MHGPQFTLTTETHIISIRIFAKNEEKNEGNSIVFFFFLIFLVLSYNL